MPFGAKPFDLSGPNRLTFLVTRFQNSPALQHLPSGIKWAARIDEFPVPGMRTILPTAASQTEQQTRSDKAHQTDSALEDPIPTARLDNFGARSRRPKKGRDIIIMSKPRKGRDIIIFNRAESM